MIFKSGCRVKLRDNDPDIQKLYPYNIQIRTTRDKLAQTSRQLNKNNINHMYILDSIVKRYSDIIDVTFVFEREEDKLLFALVCH